MRKVFEGLRCGLIGRCLMGVGAVTLAMASGAGAAALPGQKALECAAGIEIDSITEDMANNALFHVVLRLTNTQSNDSMDMAQPQRFGPVSFYPDCSSFTPPTCTAPPVPGLKLVPGSGSSDCNVPPAPPQGTSNLPTLNMAAVFADHFEFSFSPPLELTNDNGVPPPRPPTSCTISFDLEADPVPTMPTDFDILTSVEGECQFPIAGPLTNQTSVTDTISFTPAVPTAGEYALAALALLLLVGSLVILRRRRASAIG